MTETSEVQESSKDGVQVVAHLGQCLVVRHYNPEDLAVEPRAAHSLYLLSLGPGLVFINSVTIRRASHGELQDYCFVVGKVVEPGQPLELMTPLGMLDFLSSIGQQPLPEHPAELTVYDMTVTFFTAEGKQEIALGLRAGTVGRQKEAYFVTVTYD